MTTTTNPILASLNRSTNATAQSGKDGSGKVDEDPQNRFLTLLVNQLKNQDPLNPMENAEVTSQMAQISTVSGIDRLNITLESMSSSLASAQSMQAGSMIGRGVVVPGDKVDYQGGAVPLSFDLAGAAARGTVTIRDLNREFGWRLPDGPAATIAGLVMHESRAIPDVGQVFVFHGLRFEVLRRKRNQVALLRVLRAAATR
jgi:flagellar basal-body rod modification protein FlgD